MNIVPIREISELLKVKSPTIYAWVHNGTDPFYKLNVLLRFGTDEVVEWAKGCVFQCSENIKKNLPICMSTQSSKELMKAVVQDVTIPINWKPA